MPGSSSNILIRGSRSLTAGNANNYLPDEAIFAAIEREVQAAWTESIKKVKQRSLL